jgi:hypothetical protein
MYKLVDRFAICLCSDAYGLIPELIEKLKANLQLDVPGSPYFGLELDIFVE